MMSPNIIDILRHRSPSLATGPLYQQPTARIHMFPAHELLRQIVEPCMSPGTINNV